MQTLGSNPTASDARNIEAVYNTLRRAGLNWSSSDPADSLALHVGRLDPSNSVVEDTSSYTNADRAHADVYLYHPSRRTTGVPDGRWPSLFLSDNEDFSTGHSASDPKRLNSVMVFGPPAAQAIDLSGTGWTSPAGLWRMGVSHEFAHSFPPGDVGVLSELWSAGAEALNGIHDTSASSEVPYTWSLLAGEPDLARRPTCTEVRRSTSNSQGRTSFMAYVAYNFLNADSARTLAGSSDDLMSRWAKRPTRDLAALEPLLSDANCATCASRSYFHPGGRSLTGRERLNVLLHNWRTANFVNSPTAAERQLGYPTWAGFDPATNQKAWQSFDGCTADDIVALPAILTLTSRQITRDTVLAGLRTLSVSIVNDGRCALHGHGL